MSNSLTPMSPTYWSKRMGRKLYKTDIFRSLANFEEQASLKDGQKVDRPYRSNIVSENYSKGTALTAQDLTATSDQLTVDTVKAMLLYVDNVDKIQNKYSAANEWIDEAGRRLSNSIDAKFLYQAYNANNTIDDGDIGGTSGDGITLTTGNILDVFGAINMKLDVNNVPDGKGERFLAHSPQFYNVLWKYIAGKESLLGDKTGENGNIGAYAGLDLFKTNNLTGAARWTPANRPSAADTVTINGITFTFQTTIGVGAGAVLSVTDTVTTLGNLVALINAGGVGDGVNNVSVSTANQRTIQDWVAVNGTTYIEVRAMGASYMTVTGSDAADVWTATQQIQNQLAGRKGTSIDAVIQKEPSVEMASTVSAGKSGVNILPMTLFGVYVFNQGKNEIVRVKIRSDAF
jgi:hypothetical protein